MRKKPFFICSLVLSFVTMYMYRLFVRWRFQRMLNDQRMSGRAVAPLSDASHMGKWLRWLLQ